MLLKSGIYMISNKINKKKYIGQSVNIDKRIREHFNSLRKNKHQNNHLQSAFNKYGEYNFEVKILEICSAENLNEREKYYINLYKSTSRKFGYNIESGGNNSPVSNETKNKLMHSLSTRDIEDIINIKKDLYNGVPRNKIREKYNISKGSLDAIAQLNNYKSVASELNDTILHKKKRENEKRDCQILELLQKGLSNTQISNKLQISKNIIEKVKYKYPNLRFKNKDIRIKNYNMVQQLKEKGYRPCQIAKILGISSSVVYRYYKGEANPNNRLPYEKVNDELINKIILFSDEYNYSQIAKIIGLSRTTIKNVLDNYKYANTEVSD